jgi:putative transcriptional regulator
MSNGHITSKTAEAADLASDWRRFDAMSEEERHRAALEDPDARPLEPEDFNLETAVDA